MSYPTTPATVELQDMTNPPLDLRMVRETGEITLAVAGVLGAGTITLVALHGVVNGDVICLKYGDHFYQGFVTNVATNVISLSAPLDYAYPLDSIGHKATDQLAVDGSTPVTFSLKPSSTSAWHITGLLFSLVDNVAMDDSLFGGITALTKGVLIRKKDGNYLNLFNIRSNADFQITCQSTAYADKPPSGLYGFRAYKGFQVQQGIVIEIDGSTADELQVIIQDNLSALSSFKIGVIGHVVVP